MAMPSGLSWAAPPSAVSPHLSICLVYLSSSCCWCWAVTSVTDANLREGVIKTLQLWLINAPIQRQFLLFSLCNPTAVWGCETMAPYLPLHLEPYLISPLPGDTQEVGEKPASCLSSPHLQLHGQKHTAAFTPFLSLSLHFLSPSSAFLSSSLSPCAHSSTPLNKHMELYIVYRFQSPVSLIRDLKCLHVFWINRNFSELEHVGSMSLHIKREFVHGSALAS